MAQDFYLVNPTKPKPLPDPLLEVHQEEDPFLLFLMQKDLFDLVPTGLSALDPMEDEAGLITQQPLSFSPEMMVCPQDAAQCLLDQREAPLLEVVPKGSTQEEDPCKIFTYVIFVLVQQPLLPAPAIMVAKAKLKPATPTRASTRLATKACTCSVAKMAEELLACRLDFIMPKEDNKEEGLRCYAKMYEQPLEPNVLAAIKYLCCVTDATTPGIKALAAMAAAGEANA